MADVSPNRPADFAGRLYHVAGANWRPGDDLRSWDALDTEKRGDWKWSGDAPEGRDGHVQVYDVSPPTRSLTMRRFLIVPLVLVPFCGCQPSGEKTVAASAPATQPTPVSVLLQPKKEQPPAVEPYEMKTEDDGKVALHITDLDPVGDHSYAVMATGDKTSRPFFCVFTINPGIEPSQTSTERITLVLDEFNLPLPVVHRSEEATVIRGKERLGEGLFCRMDSDTPQKIAKSKSLSIMVGKDTIPIRPSQLVGFREFARRIK